MILTGVVVVITMDVLVTLLHREFDAATSVSEVLGANYLTNNTLTGSAAH